MICEHIFVADYGDYNDDDDIDDDGNLITHDCIDGDDGECDDHLHAAMCKFAV